MPNREQIGPKVDSDLWKRFRENVKRRKGQTRGTVGTELENAIRQYLDGDPDAPSEQVNARLARIEQELGIGATDGGGTTVSTPEHTHTPTERPAPNTAQEKKEKWLAKCLTDYVGAGWEQCHIDEIREVVKSEYSFRADVAKRYVEQLKEHFELTEHPTIEGLYVKPERKEELLQQKREELRQEASEELDQ